MEVPTVAACASEKKWVIESQTWFYKGYISLLLKEQEMDTRQWCCFLRSFYIYHLWYARNLLSGSTIMIYGKIGCCWSYKSYRYSGRLVRKWANEVRQLTTISVETNTIKRNLLRSPISTNSQSEIDDFVRSMVSSRRSCRVFSFRCTMSLRTCKELNHASGAFHGQFERWHSTTDIVFIVQLLFLSSCHGATMRRLVNHRAGCWSMF